ncbi:MAG: hypothetical protein LBV12_03045 [Puniceicoccales bacterium]|jgi:hypothetical protein|nr:hypothetical protein [Puniceicoccales bacterium]
MLEVYPFTPLLYPKLVTHFIEIQVHWVAGEKRAYYVQSQGWATHQKKIAKCDSMHKVHDYEEPFQPRSIAPRQPE